MLLDHVCHTFMHREVAQPFGERVLAALAFYKGGFRLDGGTRVCGPYPHCVKHESHTCWAETCRYAKFWRWLHWASGADAPLWRVYGRAAGQIWRGITARATATGWMFLLC